MSKKSKANNYLYNKNSSDIVIARSFGDEAISRTSKNKHNVIVAKFSEI